MVHLFSRLILLFHHRKIPLRKSWFIMPHINNLPRARKVLTNIAFERDIPFWLLTDNSALQGMESHHHSSINWISSFKNKQVSYIFAAIKNNLGYMKYHISYIISKIITYLGKPFTVNRYYTSSLILILHLEIALAKLHFIPPPFFFSLKMLAPSRNLWYRKCLWRG